MTVSLHSSTATQTDPEPGAWHTYHATFSAHYMDMPPQDIVIEGLGTLRNAQSGSQMHQDYATAVLSPPFRVSASTSEANDLRHRLWSQSLTLAGYDALSHAETRLAAMDRTPLLGKMASMMSVSVGAGMVAYGLMRDDQAWAFTGAALLGGGATFMMRLREEAQQRAAEAQKMDEMRATLDGYWASEMAREV